MREFFHELLRLSIAFNVGLAGTIGSWVLWHRIGTPDWMAVLLIVFLVPGWSVAAWKGSA